jgi:hypothetical protein
MDDDDLIHAKGTEADNWLVRKFTEIYEGSGQIKALPLFDITAGTINGTAAPQDMKDLASNRATYLVMLVLRQFEPAKEYKEHAVEQLQAIERGLPTSENVNATAAII